MKCFFCDKVAGAMCINSCGRFLCEDHYSKQGCPNCIKEADAKRALVEKEAADALTAKMTAVCCMCGCRHGSIIKDSHNRSYNGVPVDLMKCNHGDSLHYYCQMHGSNNTCNPHWEGADIRIDDFRY
jgi:hypothetical protein